MGKIKLILGASILLLVSLQADAVIIGDKDWFQVSRTTGFGWEGFESKFRPSTGECRRVECIITDIDGRESNLTEYIWATTDDVSELLAGYGIGPAFTKDENGEYRLLGVNLLDDFFNDFDPTRTNVVEGILRDWIVPTNTFALHYSVVGLINADFGHDVVFQDYEYLDEFPFEPLPRPLPGQGGWFYKAVPEPAAIWLFGTGLLGLLFARKKVAKS
jgi:hypothetical protein